MNKNKYLEQQFKYWLHWAVVWRDMSNEKGNEVMTKYNRAFMRTNALNAVWYLKKL